MKPVKKKIEGGEVREKVLGKVHLAVRTEFFNANKKNMEFLADDILKIIDSEIDKARQEEWDKIHTKYEVGDIIGDYKITDRFRRIGKNTKYRVVCVLCGRPMFRYSNKFKLPHRDCPAYYKQPPKTLLEESNGLKGDIDEK